MRPHPGPEWNIFHILTSEDINDVISRCYTHFKMASKHLPSIYHNENYMAAWRYEYYFLMAKTIFHSPVMLVRKRLFSLLKDKIHIFTPPYIYSRGLDNSSWWYQHSLFELLKWRPLAVRAVNTLSVHPSWHQFGCRKVTQLVITQRSTHPHSTMKYCIIYWQGKFPKECCGLWPTSIPLAIYKWLSKRIFHSVGVDATLSRALALSAYPLFELIILCLQLLNLLLQFRHFQF